MSEAKPSSRRNQKIEPLSWEVAAKSPALKGMTSFLDISPDDVRRNNFDGFGPLRAAAASTGVLSAVGIASSPGVEMGPGVLAGAGDVVDFAPAVEERTERKNVKSLQLLRGKGAAPELLQLNAALDEQDDFVGASRRLEARSAHSSAEAQSGSQTDDRFSNNEMVPAVEMSPEYVSSPGGGTYSVRDTALHVQYDFYIADPQTSRAPTPGRGRSKIRRCVLAQDGHSLGEEAIYQVLWRSGRAENGDPNGSRTNRMGAADIGYKVNMAKKNVRQNISRLFEKLAVEIIEDFETMNSQARLYRVYSYKQILERRRAAGLEYVMRNKGVVFCSKDGTTLVSSPAYVSSPGDEASIKPAPPKKRRVPASGVVPNYPHTSLTAQTDESSDHADIQIVSRALNRYWSVDQAAAVQLLRACRKVRADARADEIAFFVQEKLELARTSRTITNPTGLILAMVPQSFAGVTLDDFRERVERHGKFVAEEASRKAQQESELRAWIIRDRDRFEAIVSDPSKSERERDEAEKRLREIAAWND